MLSLPNTEPSKLEALASFSLESSNEDDIISAIKAIEDELGTVSGLIHVSKEAAKTECVSSMLDTDEEEILRTVFFMAKHLKEKLKRIL